MIPDWFSRATGIDIIRLIFDETVMLRFIHKGDPAKPILFYIHGWPDTADVWDKQLKFFEDRYCCLAPVLSNFGEDKDASIDFYGLAQLPAAN